MKLTFLGTRGYIKCRNKNHEMHSSLMISNAGKRVLVDCGADWQDKISQLKPDAIVITHAHPDHAGGLKNGSPCPVHATQEAWQTMKRYQIEDRRQVHPRAPVDILGLTFEAFQVEHSIRAPAVGYRITLGDTWIFYAPDLVYIHDREAALSDLQLYIGDGASIARPIVRKRDNLLIGHVPIRTQLTWCAKENIPKAVFTHCGSQIVCDNEAEALDKVHAFAAERGLDAEIAYDGMQITMA